MKIYKSLLFTWQREELVERQLRHHHELFVGRKLMVNILALQRRTVCWGV